MGDPGAATEAAVVTRRVSLIFGRGKGSSKEELPSGVCCRLESNDNQRGKATTQAHNFTGLKKRTWLEGGEQERAKLSSL